MASTDARPVPRKNTAFRVYFPILDADGDPVSAAAGLDSEVSLDGAAFADCTNEATEIGTSGFYYLDLTSGEMNADAVIVQVKTSTSGAKTTPVVLYPEEAGDIRVNVTQISDDATAADNCELFFDGTGYASAGSVATITDYDLHRGTAQAGAAGSITLAAGASATDALYAGALVTIVSGAGAGQVRLIAGYTGSTKVATVTPNWTSTPDNTSVYAVLAWGPSDLRQWLGAAVSAAISGRLDVNVGAMQADVVTAAAIAADAIGSSELATTAVNEIRDAILSDSTPFQGARIDAAITSRATPAQVNAEVLDVLNVDTFTEPASVPSATSTLREKIGWLFALARNKVTQTATTQTLRNAGDSADLATASVSDDGTTFTRGNFT